MHPVLAHDRNSQALDFIELFFTAYLLNNPSKPLIYKALEALAVSFQQSYPQIFWMTSKAL
jgi:hypothetical protein